MLCQKKVEHVLGSQCTETNECDVVCWGSGEHQQTPLGPASISGKHRPHPPSFLAPPRKTVAAPRTCGPAAAGEQASQTAAGRCGCSRSGRRMGGPGSPATLMSGSSHARRELLLRARSGMRHVLQHTRTSVRLALCISRQPLHLVLSAACTADLR